MSIESMEFILVATTVGTETDPEISRASPRVVLTPFVATFIWIYSATDLCP